MICGTAETQSLTEDHGVSCGYKSGGNKEAGSIVERAVGIALKRLEDEVQKVPQLDLQIGFEKIDPNKKAKEFGDFATYHRGRRMIIDVSMTSNPSVRTVEKVETNKAKEYQENRRFDPSRFVAFALDNCGRWGSQAVQYLKEANQDRIAKCEMARYDQELRYAVEGVSLAICKANAVYLRRMRQGIPGSSKPEEEELVIPSSEGESQLSVASSGDGLVS